MKKNQRDKIHLLYRKLGSSKTKQLVEKIRNHEKVISHTNILEWSKLNPQYSQEFFTLMNSFQCPESICIALEMQDEMESKQLQQIRDTKLVITSPLMGHRIGHTLGNFKKIIETAKHEIILVGYVFVNVDGQMNPILDLLLSATSRGIDVKIFFQKGPSIKLLKSIWKGKKPSEIPEFYLFNDKNNSKDKGVLHAKAIIKDDDTILVTSANMTGNAMEKNLEFGILHEGKIAIDAKKMLYDLIENGYMVKKN